MCGPSLKTMTSATFRKSIDSKRSDKTPAFSKQSRLKCWEHSPPQAIVYDPSSPHLTVEEINEINSKLSNNPVEFTIDLFNRRVQLL